MAGRRKGRCAIGCRADIPGGQILAARNSYRVVCSSRVTSEAALPRSVVIWKSSSWRRYFGNLHLGDAILGIVIWKSSSWRRYFGNRHFGIVIWKRYFGNHHLGDAILESSFWRRYFGNHHLEIVIWWTKAPTRQTRMHKQDAVGKALQDAAGKEGSRPWCAGFNRSSIAPAPHLK